MSGLGADISQVHWKQQWLENGTLYFHVSMSTSEQLIQTTVPTAQEPAHVLHEHMHLLHISVMVRNTLLPPLDPATPHPHISPHPLFLSLTTSSPLSPFSLPLDSLSSGELQYHVSHPSVLSNALICFSLQISHPPSVCASAD